MLVDLPDKYERGLTVHIPMYGPVTLCDGRDTTLAEDNYIRAIKDAVIKRNNLIASLLQEDEADTKAKVIAALDLYETEKRIAEKNLLNETMELLKYKLSSKIGPLS